MKSLLFIALLGMGTLIPFTCAKKAPAEKQGQLAVPNKTTVA